MVLLLLRLLLLLWIVVWRAGGGHGGDQRRGAVAGRRRWGRRTLVGQAETRRSVTRRGRAGQLRTRTGSRRCCREPDPRTWEDVTRRGQARWTSKNGNTVTVPGRDGSGLAVSDSWRLGGLEQGEWGSSLTTRRGASRPPRTCKHKSSRARIGAPCLNHTHASCNVGNCIITTFPGACPLAILGSN